MDSKDVLQREIVGEPVTVSLGGKDYELAYSIFAVSLYKQETAKLNVRRAKEAQDAGRAKLSPAEVRELRTRYNRLIDERQGKSNAELAVLHEELVGLRVQLDEEAGTGDSLFQYVNWWKIRDEDPDRILLALWAGLHQERADEKWESPFTLGQLRKLVDFSNVGPVAISIGKALFAYMPKVKEKDKSPNGRGPDREMPAEEMTAAK